MRKVRAIFMICFALLFGMQGVRMYAQVVGSPVNDKNAIDYRY